VFSNFVGSVTRRKRTDERSFAFENLVDPIRAASFIITILNEHEEPILNVSFDVSIDASEDRSMNTDADGTLKTTKPKSRIGISLLG